MRCSPVGTADFSPRREPWEQDEKSDRSPGGAKEIGCGMFSFAPQGLFSDRNTFSKLQLFEQRVELAFERGFPGLELRQFVAQRRQLRFLRRKLPRVVLYLLLLPGDAV